MVVSRDTSVGCVGERTSGVQSDASAQSRTAAVCARWMSSWSCDVCNRSERTAGFAVLNASRLRMMVVNGCQSRKRCHNAPVESTAGLRRGCPLCNVTLHGRSGRCTGIELIAAEGGYSHHVLQQLCASATHVSSQHKGRQAPCSRQAPRSNCSRWYECPIWGAGQAMVVVLCACSVLVGW
jgi:hypothetical protein